MSHTAKFALAALLPLAMQTSASGQNAPQAQPSQTNRAPATLPVTSIKFIGLTRPTDAGPIVNFMLNNNPALTVSVSSRAFYLLKERMLLNSVSLTPRGFEDGTELAISDLSVIAQVRDESGKAVEALEEHVNKVPTDRHVTAMHIQYGESGEPVFPEHDFTVTSLQYMGIDQNAGGRPAIFAINGDSGMRIGIYSSTIARPGSTGLNDIKATLTQSFDGGTHFVFASPEAEKQAVAEVQKARAQFWPNEIDPATMPKTVEELLLRQAAPAPTSQKLEIQ